MRWSLRAREASEVIPALAFAVARGWRNGVADVVMATSSVTNRHSLVIQVAKDSLSCRDSRSDSLGRSPCQRMLSSCNCRKPRRNSFAYLGQAWRREPARLTPAAYDGTRTGAGAAAVAARHEIDVERGNQPRRTACGFEREDFGILQAVVGEKSSPTTRPPRTSTAPTSWGWPMLRRAVPAREFHPAHHRRGKS